MSCRVSEHENLGGFDPRSPRGRFARPRNSREEESGVSHRGCNRRHRESPHHPRPRPTRLSTLEELEKGTYLGRDFLFSRAIL